MSRRGSRILGRPQVAINPNSRSGQAALRALARVDAFAKAANAENARRAALNPRLDAEFAASVRAFQFNPTQQTALNMEAAFSAARSNGPVPTKQVSSRNRDIFGPDTTRGVPTVAGGDAAFIQARAMGFLKPKGNKSPFSVLKDAIVAGAIVAAAGAAVAVAGGAIAGAVETTGSGAGFTSAGVLNTGGIGGVSTGAGTATSIIGSGGTISGGISATTSLSAAQAAASVTASVTASTTASTVASSVKSAYAFAKPAIKLASTAFTIKGALDKKKQAAQNNADRIATARENAALEADKAELAILDSEIALAKAKEKPKKTKQVLGWGLALTALGFVLTG